MRFLSLVCAAVGFWSSCSAAAIAEDKTDKSEKVLTETQFVRKLVAFDRKTFLSGTDANKDVQWAERVADFQKMFEEPVSVSFDGMLSEVRWKDGIASLIVAGRNSQADFKNTFVTPNRVLKVPCSQSAAQDLKVRERVKVLARLRFEPYFESYSMPGLEGSLYVIDFSRDRRILKGRFVVESLNVGVGDREFVFEESSSKKKK